MVPVYNPSAGAKEKKVGGALKGTALTAQKALIRSLEMFGIDPPEQIKVEMSSYLPGDKIITVSEWRFMSYRMGISDSESQDSKLKAFSRAKEVLEYKGLIGILDGFCWLNR